MSIKIMRWIIPILLALNLFYDILCLLPDPISWNAFYGLCFQAIFSIFGLHKIFNLDENLNEKNVAD